MCWIRQALRDICYFSVRLIQGGGLMSSCTDYLHGLYTYVH